MGEVDIYLVKSGKAWDLGHSPLSSGVPPEDLKLRKIIDAEMRRAG